MTSLNSKPTPLDILNQRFAERQQSSAPTYSTDLSELLKQKDELISQQQAWESQQPSLSGMGYGAGTPRSPQAATQFANEQANRRNAYRNQLKRLRDQITGLTGDPSSADMTYDDWSKLFLTEEGGLIQRTEQYQDKSLPWSPETYTVDAEGYRRGLIPYSEGSTTENLGTKTTDAMGLPPVWEHLESGRLRLQQQAAEQIATDLLKAKVDPKFAKQQRAMANAKSAWARGQEASRPTGVFTFLEDVGSGAYEFMEQGAAHMLYPFAVEEEMKASLDDIKQGKLRIYGGVRDKYEIAARFHNPEGWGRKIGSVSAAAGMSVVALASPGAGQMAVLGAFGQMGLGQGMAEYDRIVKETGIKPNDADRLLMGIGYGVAEAGAEFAGLAGARLGAALIGKTAAKELGEEAVSNGLMAAVKKYGSKYGIASIAVGSATEGGEEVLTTVAHNMIRNHYDPRRVWYEDMGEGTLDAFILGSIGGGMIVGPAVATKGLSNVQMERRIAAQEKRLGARAILEADIDETQQAIEAAEAVTPETIPVQLAEEGEMPKVEVAGEWVEATEEAKAQAVAEKRAEILSGQKGQIENEQGEMVPATPELVEAAMARSKAQLGEMQAEVKEAAPDAQEAAAEAVEEVTEETEEEPAEEPSEAPVETAEAPVMSGRVVITKGGVPVEETGEGPREWEFGGDTAEQSEDLFDRAVDQAEAELDRLGDEYDLEIIEDGEDGPLMSPAETVESSEIDDAFRRQQKRRLETRAKRLEDEAAKTEDGEDKARLLRQAAAAREQANATGRQEGDPPGVKVIPRKEEARTPVYRRLRAWAKKSGIQIRQVETRGGIPFEGLYHNGTIYVDASRVRKSKGETSKDAWTTGVFARILSHELVHAGRDVNPRVYDYLRDNLGNRAAGRAFETYRRRLGRSGAGQMQQLSPSLRLEEAVADAVSDTLKKIGAGRFMGDQSIVADLIDFIRSTASKYGLRGKFAKALDDIVRQMSEGKTLSEMAVPDKVRSRPTPPRQLERVMLSPGEALPWSIKNAGDGDLYIRRVGPNAGEVSKERQGPSDFAITVDQSVLMPDYLRYVVMSLQPQLSARKKGTAQQSITQKDINDVLTDFFVKQSGQMSPAEISDDIKNEEYLDLIISKAISDKEKAQNIDDKPRWEIDLNSLLDVTSDFDPSLKPLVDHLKGYDATGLKVFYDRTGKVLHAGLTGFYSPDEHHVVLTKSVDPGVAIHELVHGFSVRQLMQELPGVKASAFNRSKTGVEYVDGIWEALDNPNLNPDVRSLANAYLQVAEELDYMDVLTKGNEYGTGWRRQEKQADVPSDLKDRISDENWNNPSTELWQFVGKSRDNTYPDDQGFIDDYSFDVLLSDDVSAIFNVYDDSAYLESDDQNAFFNSERELLEAIEKRHTKIPIGGFIPGKGVANKGDVTLRYGLPYGMTNLDEFIAEAISDKKFQDILAGIEYRGDQVVLGESVGWPARSSILSKIIEAIRNLLNIKPQTPAESVLREVITASQGVMETQSSNVKDRSYEVSLLRRRGGRPILSPAETGTEFNQRQKDWIRVLDMHHAAEDPVQQLWYDDLDMAATMFNESFFDEVRGELPQKDGFFYPDIIEMDNDSTARERVPEKLTAEDVIPVREHYRNLTYQWLLETKGPGPYRLFRGDVKGMHRGQNLPEDMRAGLPLGVFTSSELFTAQEFAGQDRPSAKDKTVEQYDEVWPEEILYAVEAFDKVGSFDESNYLVLADALKPTQTILGRVKKDDFTWMPVWSPTEDLTPEEQKAAEEETLESIAGDDLVAHAAIMIVRDGLSDFGLWYEAMRARYNDSNFDFDAEANEIWRDANVLADYIWDESETGYSARKATELRTKAERDDYSGLRRQLRLQRKAAEDAATEARGEERERGRGRLEKQAREAEAREGRIAARTEAANFRALKHKLRAESAAARQGMVLGRQLGLEKGLAKGAERLDRLKMKIQKEKADLRELKSDFRNILKVMGWSSKKLRSKLPTAAVREDFTTRRRMIQVVEEVAEIVEQLRKEHAQNLLRKVLKSLDLNKMRPEFRDAMKEVLDEADIGVKEYSPGEDKRLRAVQKYVSSDASRIEQIPNSIVRKMALLRGQKISDLSIEDAQQIREALLQLKHQNNVKNKLLGRVKRRDFLRSRESIIGELDNTFKNAERDSQGRKITKNHWALRRLWSKFNMLTLDRMAMFMGNASRNSESYKRLYADMADGQTEMLRDFQSDKDYLLSEMEAAGIGVTLEAMSEMSEPHSKERGRLKAMLDGDLTGKTRKDPKHTQYMDIKLENGDTLTITPAERISLLMHLRDLDTREQILKRGERKSELWVPRLAKRFSLSVEDVNTIEDMQGEARDKENAIAAIMLARINGAIRNRMAEYSVELHGYDITRDGTYNPRRRYGTPEAQFDDEAWAEVEQYGLDHSGITKERTGGNLPIVLGDAFVEFNNHSYTVAGLRNMAAPMRNMRKLLGNNTTKEFLDAKQRGGDIQKYFRTLLNDLAKDIVGGPGKGAIVDNAATRFARRFTVGALGANPRVMFYQVASLAAASSDMPPQYIGPATRNALGPGGSAITEEMRLRSPYLRERFDSDAYGLVSEGLDRTQGTLVERKKLADRMMGGIAKFDEMAIRTIWTASKDWVAHDIRTGKLEGVSVGDGKYWQEVRNRAEATVKRTQPTMDLLHVTPLSRAGRRGSGLSRIISMFASQRHKNVNMLWEVYMDLKSGRKANALRALAFHSVLQPLILWSMRGVYGLAFGELASKMWELWRGPSPEEEEEDYWRLSSMMDSVVTSIFGNLPLGDLPGYATRKILAEFSEDAPRIREPSVSPVISSVVDLTTLTANLSTAILSEDKEVTEGQMYTLIRNMSTATGIPASPLYDLWRSNMGRTTYTELAKKRYYELNRKNTKGELSSEEKSERRKFQRAFSSSDVSKGISALLKEAKEAEGKGNTKRAESLRDKAEKKARRVYGE